MPGELRKSDGKPDHMLNRAQRGTAHLLQQKIEERGGDLVAACGCDVVNSIEQITAAAVFSLAAQVLENYHHLDKQQLLEKTARRMKEETTTVCERTLSDGCT